ncbi:MAG: hypothetical protein Q7S21_07245 [archaeon]|nr:hypothetical protein [archaeon]
MAIEAKYKPIRKTVRTIDKYLIERERKNLEKQYPIHIEHNGITVYSKVPISKKVIEGMVEEVALANLLANKLRIRFVPQITSILIIENSKNSRVGVQRDRLEIGDKFFLIPGAYKPVTFHECVHSLQSSDSPFWSPEYFYNILQTGKMSKEHPLMLAFDESTYLQKINPSLKIDENMGHPWRGPKEFFASTSTILRHFPKEFIEQTAKLHELNNEYYKTAMDVAKHTVEVYGEFAKNVFSQELRDFLNKH